MIDEPLGFHVKAPVSAWNQRLGVEYQGIFKALAKAGVAYLSGNAAGAVNAAIDGIAAFKLEDDTPPPELAWHLIRRALARATAELTIEALSSLDRDPEDPSGLVARLDSALDQATIWFDLDFYRRPTDLPIVGAVRAPFGEWLGGFGLGQARVDSTTRRLPAYFTFALHREWAAEPTLYAPIDAELKKADTPFARAFARERAWLKNAAYLQRLVREPVFGESFGINDLYIDLRAYWVERQEQRGGSRQVPPDGAGQREEKRHVVDLKSHLRAWLDRADRDDAIRVVCGGPGSGKTSFAKMFAAELAETSDYGVLYIPLHEFDFAGDFRAALPRYLVDDARILVHDPLDDEDRRHLVVFFDGLDELAMEGRAGQEAALEFCDQLDRQIDKVNRDGCRLKIILGGREVVVQANDRVFKRPGQILHVLPYFVQSRKQIHRYDLLCREDFDDPGRLLDTDDRDRWWANYGELTGRAYTELPGPLHRGAPDEISAQPLFNYLLALSFERQKLPFGAGLNQNRLYRDLLEAVWERRWGKRQIPEIDRLEFAEFEGILKEISLAAWHAGARGVSASTIAELCARAGLDQQIKAFEKGAEQGALSLMAAFYFKQTKRTGERAYEFTHKTFGEYLAACRLIDAIAELEEEAADRRAKRRRWDDEAALVRWIRLSGPAALDRDLLRFMRRQIALGEEDEGLAIISCWQQTIAELLSYALEHALPMHLLGPATFQEMTRNARNAEEALLAAHDCCAWATGQPSPIKWPTPFALRDLLARLDQGEGRLARSCLGMLGNHDGRACHWLAGADLEGADLSGANLAVAILQRANLTFANLKRAFLVGAIFTEAYLFRANLESANLEGAVFVEANLKRANLEGAHLEGADLEGVNLVAVRRLDGAHGLDKVKSWRGAKIERKSVERLGLDSEKLGLEVVDDLDEEPADPASPQP